MTVVELGDGKPSARYWHSMAVDPATRTYGPGQSGHAAFMFGGALGASNYSGELWALWIFQNGTVGWKRRTFGGTAPAARARQSLAFNPEQGSGAGRLYLFGGENASGAADKFSYVVDPWAAAPAWQQWQQHEANFSGHTLLIDRAADKTFARFPEVFDPQTGQWQLYGSAPLNWTLTYPQNFTVPGAAGAGGRILNVGPEAQAYWLDMAAPGQQPQAG